MGENRKRDFELMMINMGLVGIGIRRSRLAKLGPVWMGIAVGLDGNGNFDIRRDEHHTVVRLGHCQPGYLTRLAD